MKDKISKAGREATKKGGRAGQLQNLTSTKGLPLPSSEKHKTFSSKPEDLMRFSGTRGSK